MLGVVLYLLVLGVLMQFDWLKILRPIPFLAVVLGVVILTVSQYKKGMKMEDVLAHAQWNAFFAGLLTSLLSLLSAFSSDAVSGLAIQSMAENMIPLIYGSLLYLIMEFLFKHTPHEKEPILNKAIIKRDDAFTPQVANPILIAKGLSSRECHVALKLMEGISNKEIAQQLFISEATVKKHIQNMFRKCEATDRQHFLTLYLEWVNESSEAPRAVE